MSFLEDWMLKRALKQLENIEGIKFHGAISANGTIASLMEVTDVSENEFFYGVLMDQNTSWYRSLNGSSFWVVLLCNMLLHELLVLSFKAGFLFSLWFLCVCYIF